MNARKNHYEILQVNRTATSEEIKESYNNLVRIHHPDNGGDLDTFTQILEAGRTLKDSKERQLYDEGLNWKKHADGFSKSLEELHQIIQEEKHKDAKKELRNIKIAMGLYLGLAISSIIAASLHYPTVSTSFLIVQLPLVGYLLSKGVKIINEQRNRNLFFEKEILPTIKKVATRSSTLRDACTPKLAYR